MLTLKSGTRLEVVTPFTGCCLDPAGTIWWGRFEVGHRLILAALDDASAAVIHPGDGDVCYLVLAKELYANCRIIKAKKRRAKK